MAYLPQNIFKVQYQFIDTLARNGGRSSTTIHIGELAGQVPNTNEAEWLAYIDELGDSMAALSDCYIPRVTVSRSYINDAAPAFGGSPDVERKLLWLFNTQDGASSRIAVPGAKYELFASDGQSIQKDQGVGPGAYTGNPQAVALQDVHDKLVNGVTINLGTYPATDGREFDIVSERDIYKQHIANNRG